MELEIPTAYLPFDADRPSEADLRLRKDLEWRKPDEAIMLRGFTALSIVLDAGFRRVSYLSHELDSGHLYWFTDDHARALAGILPAQLDYFGLVVTCPASDGMNVLAKAVGPAKRVRELLVKHAAGDEVSVQEARGVARLAAALHCERVHLWAAEYDPGAVEALCDELNLLAPPDLHELDLCDTSKPEPDDVIATPGCRALLERNRRSAT